MGELNLRVLGIKGAGKLEDERVILLVTKDDNLGNYVVFFAKETGEDTISAKLIMPIWFPDVDVKVNDKIVVYTRKGRYGKKVTEQGESMHFYYRNSDEPLCTSEDIGTVVLRVDGWQFESTRM